MKNEMMFTIGRIMKLQSLEKILIIHCLHTVCLEQINFVNPIYLFIHIEIEAALYFTVLFPIHVGIVFAITGSLSAYLSKPFTNYIGLTEENLGGFFLPVRLLAIFPIYQVLLVLIGFLFGQFTFFWWFEKKMLRGMKLGFIADWFEKKRF